MFASSKTTATDATMSEHDNSDALRLADDVAHVAPVHEKEWIVLVVDDDEDVHTVTNLVLQEETILGRKIRLLHAYSGAEAIAILKKERDIAVILLDVVMESEEDGLLVAAFARLSWDNAHTRIIMRTGQPGAISERAAVKDYQINYYEPKSQLTSERLKAVVYMAIDAYQASARLAHTIEHLESTLADLQLFSDAVAHDIKTPARQIALMADLLQDQLSTESPKDAHALASKIGAAGRHLLDMIDQLLDLSRMGKDSLNICTVNIEELFEAVLALLKVELPDAEIDISLDVDPELRIQVDREKFQHVIFNLLENAFKYRDQNRHCQVNIRAYKDGKNCRIEVKDNGVGIAENALDIIFLPFRRATNDTSISGSGVGLALCKRIVELHNGSIDATSALGEGTTIGLSLPLA